MAQKIKSFAGIKKGQKFKVVSNCNSHNYPLNKVLTFRENFTGNALASWVNCAVEGIYNSLSYKDVVLVGEDLATLEKRYVEVQEERDTWNEQNKKESEKYNKEVDKTLEDIKKKINFCKDLGITEYDDNVEKLYNAIQVINEKKDIPDIEKAKILADIIYSD